MHDIKKTITKILFSVIMICIAILLFYSNIPVFVTLPKSPEIVNLQDLQSAERTKRFISIQGQYVADKTLVIEHREGRHTYPIANKLVGAQYLYCFTGSNNTLFYVRSEKAPLLIEKELSYKKGITGVWIPFSQDESDELLRIYHSNFESNSDVVTSITKASAIMKTPNKTDTTKIRLITSGIIDYDLAQQNLFLDRSAIIYLIIGVLFMIGAFLTSKKAIFGICKI